MVEALDPFKVGSVVGDQQRGGASELDKSVGMSHK
jgi:hypothetical protein